MSCASPTLAQAQRESKSQRWADSVGVVVLVEVFEMPDGGKGEMSEAKVLIW